MTRQPREAVCLSRLPHGDDQTVLWKEQWNRRDPVFYSGKRRFNLSMRPPTKNAMIQRFFESAVNTKLTYINKDLTDNFR